MKTKSIDPSHIAFGDISVNSIETNSGIFIGASVQANGWSTMSKENNGLGSFSHTSVSQCVTIIKDDDFIDSPITDQHTFYIQKEENAQADIHFRDINVNSLDRSASVSVGETDQNGWSAHGKSNTGLGSQTGIQYTLHNQTVIQDNDAVDAPITQSTAYAR
ncbi:hypothetical protein [Caenibacillus caldisaponilyticus]|uniref:hypothetical protein n=1 Tax=Caenibacillus caldisaponilyticus TaxID=1674942 RepID=UPI00098863D2|nr:hypothetical protein [Caenibacillus caldisaponilyticus]